MKLARFTQDGRTAIGVVRGNEVFDLRDLVSGTPTSISAVLAAGRDLRQRVEAGLAQGSRGHALNDVHLEAPLPESRKYLAIGMNYEDHAEEARRAGLSVPKTQLWFNKQVTCIHGPYDPVVIPRVSSQVDYEAELGVVIGQRCRYVPVEQARSVVGGYFVANDVTARDWQQSSPTFTLGKSFDTHGPIGPWVVTDDEIVDPHALEMRLYVNGELRQRQSTGRMIHNIWQQIHHLSQVMTLEPGDLIATGTCAGVGIASGQFLQPGDVVRVEIDQVGHIENRFIADTVSSL